MCDITSYNSRQDILQHLGTLGVPVTTVAKIEDEFLSPLNVRKINAIKEVRSLANLSLKDAKDIVDALIQFPGPDSIGWFYSLDNGATWIYQADKPLVAPAILGLTN